MCVYNYIHIHEREQNMIFLSMSSDMGFRLSAASPALLLLVLVLLLPLSATASSKLYVVYMGEKKHDDPSVVTASHHDLLISVLGSKDEALKSIVYSYKHGFSGFAAVLNESQAETIANLPEVISVTRNVNYQTQTTRSWDFLGLDYYQPQNQQPGLLQRAKYGEDMIVGVIDTGIWPESRSFDDKGYGPVPARWKGACQTGEAFNSTSCNRKIIGARWFADGMDNDELEEEFRSARDHHGHGTHVASTIAGGQVWNVSYGGLAAGVARGGAPRARLAVYKACWGIGMCPAAAVIAAIDHAIKDGVDVLSVSLQLGIDFHAATLHAAASGISVVFAGGNSGPVPQTVLNAVPWVTTVAASTIDRSFPTVISLGNNETLVGQSRYFNTSKNSRNFQELVDGLSCDADTLAAIDVTDKVVLCSSTLSPALAFNDALIGIVNASAKGIIFGQYADNRHDVVDICNSIMMPCVLVDFEITRRIASYASSTIKPVVKVSRTMTVVGNGVLSPRIASFSSRGPNAKFPGILKPDVAAPGVTVLAAYRDTYQFSTGTSMACPHVSAVTALLKSVHPHWSSAMIKSAIVTTASLVDRFGMPIQADAVPRKLADPFDFGGGQMDPNEAMDPGLVFDLDAREYTKFFNCTLGSFDYCGSYMVQLYQLNLPSISVPDLKDSVTVVRTVTNVGPVGMTYRAVVETPAGVAMSVEPSVITFTKDNKRVTFKVSLKSKQRVQGGYTFGSLTWLGNTTHSVRIPIAVRTVIQDFVADTS